MGLFDDIEGTRRVSSPKEMDVAPVPISETNLALIGTVNDVELENTFLAHIAGGGKIEDAANKTGLRYQDWYARRVNDPAFKERWLDAKRAGQETRTELVDEALFERGALGVTKGIWHNGIMVGSEQQYSDRAAIEYLKAHDPAYTPRMKHEGEIGVTHNWQDLIKAIDAHTAAQEASGPITIEGEVVDADVE